MVRGEGFCSDDRVTPGPFKDRFCHDPGVSERLGARTGLVCLLVPCCCRADLAPDFRHARLELVGAAGPKRPR